METLQNILDEFKIKGHFSIGQVHKFTEKCFGEKDTFDEFEEEQAAEQLTRRDAYELVKEVISEASNGSPDHYHNYAVTFARASEYDIACDILLCGMRRYCANIDLLADYLEYAINSSNDKHYEKCEEIFELLQSRRSQFWNWRAYDFAIDYLLDKIDRGIGEPSEIKLQCIELAKEFQKCIPTSELGYIAEAKVYSLFGENSKELSVLKKALNKTGFHAVQTAIVLAEIYIKRNNPQEALKCVNRVISDFPDANLRITPSRIYALSIICKTSILLSNSQANASSDQAFDKKLAQEILSDWNKVKKFGTKGHQYFDAAESLVKLVEVIGDIQSDDEI